jgi:3-isopropylmalate/(R)-2-methylmalate dehydratase small subunit
MLPVTLSEQEVAAIVRLAEQLDNYKLTVDLERQVIEDDDGNSMTFRIDEFQRYCLLEGLDDIGLTLRYEDDIRAYEALRRYGGNPHSG